MSRRTAFEERIKESLESYEAPYDPTAWEGVEKGLDRMEASAEKGPSSGSNRRNWTKWGVGIGATLVAGGVLIMNIDNEEEDPATQERTEKTEQVSQKLEKKEEDDPVVDEQGDEPREKEEKETTNSIDEKESKERSEPNESVKEEKTTELLEEEGGEQGEDKKEKADASEEEGPTPSPEKERPEKGSSDDLPSSVRIEAVNGEGCGPLKVSFRSDAKAEKLDHFWEFGDGDYSNQANPEHRYEEAGSYTVSLTLTDAASGQTVRKVEEDLVKVHPAPEARVLASEKGEGIRPKAHFELEEQRNVEEVLWDLGDGTRVEGKEEITHRYRSKGVYPLTVELESAEGCKGSVTHRYEQKHSFNLLAPNAFSPDGDGRNDFFIPKALPELDVPFTMTIHDRQGRVIHKANRADEAWDGRIMNSGRKAQPGDVFIWVVVLEKEQGEEETYKGTVTVTP